MVVITGASSGIGKALAKKYVREGWYVAMAARRIDRLNDLKNELGPENVLSVKADITQEADCRKLVEETISRFGKIDVFINNAGISMRALFQEVELEVMRKLMDVNYWGTVYCTKYALPHLLETKGSLVGVISVGGYVGLPGRTGYSASKFAVRGFLDTIRIENLKSGLHVLVAAPGFTASEIRKTALTAKGTQQGETPRNENKMMSAEECADHIFRAIKKRKRKIILTVVEGKLTVFMAKLWADLVDRVIYKVFSNEPDSPLK